MQGRNSFIRMSRRGCLDVRLGRFEGLLLGVPIIGRGAQLDNWRVMMGFRMSARGKEAAIMDETIYERLGGEAAVSAAVDIFYRKVLRDSRISRFFDETDMEDQIAKQKSFLNMVFGGPHEYTGKDLRTAHAPLVEKGLNDTHFDAVIGHLRRTLNELNVQQDLIRKVVSVAEGTREDVLGRDVDLSSV